MRGEGRVGWMAAVRLSPDWGAAERNQWGGQRVEYLIPRDTQVEVTSGQAGVEAWSSGRPGQV